MSSSVSTSTQQTNGDRKLGEGLFEKRNENVGVTKLPVSAEYTVCSLNTSSLFERNEVESPSVNKTLNFSCSPTFSNHEKKRNKKRKRECKFTSNASSDKESDSFCNDMLDNRFEKPEKRSRCAGNLLTAGLGLICKMNEVTKASSTDTVSDNNDDDISDFFRNCHSKEKDDLRSMTKLSFDDTKIDNNRFSKKKCYKPRKRRQFIYPRRDSIKKPEFSISTDHLVKNALHWEVNNVSKNVRRENNCKSFIAKRLAVFNELATEEEAGEFSLVERACMTEIHGCDWNENTTNSSRYLYSECELFVCVAKLLFNMKHLDREAILQRLQTMWKCSSVLVTNDLLRCLYVAFVFVDRVHLGSLRNDEYRRKVIVRSITASEQRLPLSKFSFDFVDDLFCHFERKLDLFDRIGFSLEASYVRCCEALSINATSICHRDEQRKTTSRSAAKEKIKLTTPNTSPRFLPFSQANSQSIHVTDNREATTAVHLSSEKLMNDSETFGHLNFIESFEMGENTATFSAIKYGKVAIADTSMANKEAGGLDSSSLYRTSTKTSNVIAERSRNLNAGFHTANGRPIDVNESRVDVFKNECLNDILNGEIASCVTVSFDKSTRVNSPALNLNDRPALRKTTNADFRTASGKRINLDEKRIGVIENKLFQDIFDEKKNVIDDRGVSSSIPNTNHHLVSCPLGDFRTANDKPLNLNENRVNFFKDRFNELITPGDCNDGVVLPSPTLSTPSCQKKDSYEALENTNHRRANVLNVDQCFDFSREITESTSAFLLDISNNESCLFVPKNGTANANTNNRNFSVMNGVNEQSESHNGDAVIRGSPVLEDRFAKSKQMRHARRKRIPLNVACLSEIDGEEAEACHNRGYQFQNAGHNFSPKSCKRRKTSVSSSPEKRPHYESTNDHAQLHYQAAARQQFYIENKPAQLCLPFAGYYTRRTATKENDTPRLSLKAMAADEMPEIRIYSIDEYMQFGLHRAVVEVTSENATNFVFTREFFREEQLANSGSAILFGDSAPVILNVRNEATFEEVAKAFLASPGVNPKLISHKWIANHYRWVVWKLAATERSFPALFGGRYLTLDNVLYQLKFKYDREIDDAARSALKRILEGDDSPARPLVLCVATISMIPDRLQEYKIELTDGWYSVSAEIDCEMSKFVASKRVAVGTKLITIGAELVGWNQGCDPLRIEENVRLKISTNSTRRVRWYTKMGFFNQLITHMNRVKTILPNGGFISCLFAVVARVYPLLYLEKSDDLHAARVHNEKVEMKRSAVYEREREACIETLLSQVTNEVMQESDVAPAADETKIGTMVNKEKLHFIVQKRMESRLPEKFSKKRNVCTLLKLRLVDATQNSDKPTSALLSIWNACEDIIDFFKEGKSCQFYNINATGIRNGEYQLSSNRLSRYDQCLAAVTSSWYERRVTTFEDLHSNNETLFTFGEVDLVGVIIKTQFDEIRRTIYLADLQRKFLAISLRTDKENFDYGDMFHSGQIVAGINLQWRKGFLFWEIPIVFASEFTSLVGTTRIPLLQRRIDEFYINFQNNELKSFISECEQKLDSIIMLPQASSSSTISVAAKSCDSQNEPPVTSSNSKSDKNSFVSTTGLLLHGDHVMKNLNEGKPIAEKNTPYKIEVLRKYGTPPPLSSLTLTSRTRMKTPLGLPYKKKYTKTMPHSELERV